MNTAWKKPELLSPAGNLETAVAAFNAGADAVYLGLGKFNARNRAENFTHDQLARLIEYGHKNGKKIYVTLNTLITESQLPEFMNTIARLSELDIDAVIVQDFGTIYLLRKYFPQLVIHASTQMYSHSKGICCHYNPCLVIFPGILFCLPQLFPQACVVKV